MEEERWGTGVSPVVAAARPGVFLKLEVVATVEKLLEERVGFWSSPEFMDSITGTEGALLAVDAAFFEQFLLTLLQKGMVGHGGGLASAFTQLAMDWLSSTPVVAALHHFFPYCSESEKVGLVRQLQGIWQRICACGDDCGEVSLAQLLFTWEDWSGLEELRSTCAFVCHSRSYWGLLRHEEWHEERRIVVDAVTSYDDKLHNDGGLEATAHNVVKERIGEKDGPPAQRLLLVAGEVFLMRVRLSLFAVEGREAFVRWGELLQSSGVRLKEVVKKSSRKRRRKKESKPTITGWKLPPADMAVQEEGGGALAKRRMLYSAVSLPQYVADVLLFRLMNFFRAVDTS